MKRKSRKTPRAAPILLAVLLGATGCGGVKNTEETTAEMTTEMTTAAVETTEESTVAETIDVGDVWTEETEEVSWRDILRQAAKTAAEVANEINEFLNEEEY